MQKLCHKQYGENMLNNSVMINHSLTMQQKTIFTNYFLFRHKKVGEIKSIFYLFSRAEICVFFKHVDIQYLAMLVLTVPWWRLNGTASMICNICLSVRHSCSVVTIYGHISLDVTDTQCLLTKCALLLQ